ncbi:MAG: ABC transporter permease [Caloramator sp.]|nr:ABC transporter permease [Caloramator sp.]
MIFKNNLKRIFKDRGNVIFMVIMPIIIILISLFSVSSGNKLRLGVVDKDKTFLSKYIVKTLEDKANINYLDEDSIKNQIVSEKLDYAIVIEKDLTEKIIRGEVPKIKTYKLKDNELTMPFENYIDSIISNLYNIGKVAEGDSEKFKEALNVYAQKKYGVEYKELKLPNFNALMASLGMFTFLMLILGTNTSKLILDDKRYKVYKRIFSAPVKQRNYVIQNILSSYVVIFIQTTVIFLIINKMMKFNFNRTFINLYILFLIFCILSVALGTAISNISKDRVQFGYLTNLIIVPMCMLGGCYWPLDFMPSFLQKVANFVPSSWIMKSAEKIVYGAVISDLYIEVSVILLFSLIFFLIGIECHPSEK